jgi:hypothetical protein
MYTQNLGLTIDTKGIRIDSLYLVTRFGLLKHHCTFKGNLSLFMKVFKYSNRKMDAY